MMPGTLMDRIRAGAAVVDLRDGVRLQVTGPDALRYLNGQVTNDVRRLATGEAMPACITSHKGKLEAFVMICRAADEAWSISADPGLRAFLPARLEKYLIADDVVIEDVSDTVTLLHRFGPPAADSTGWTARCSRFGIPGYDWWLAPGDAERVVADLPVLTPDEISSLRAMFRIPAWETELSIDVLPQEARLEETAVDFFKGCYIGQEVISRIRSVGHVNRQLESFLQISGPPLQAGWGLFDPAGDADNRRALGVLTTVANHPVTGHRIALGYRKRGAPDQLSAGPDSDKATAAIQVRKTLDE